MPFDAELELSGQIKKMQLSGYLLFLGIICRNQQSKFIRLGVTQVVEQFVSV